MKAKMYFKQIDAENCYALENILSELRQEPYDKMEIWEAVKDKDCGYKWCAEMGEPFERGEDVCGKNCSSYSPKNGKNGCCKSYRSCYIAERKFVLHKSGKLELVKE